MLNCCLELKLNHQNSLKQQNPEAAKIEQNVKEMAQMKFPGAMNFTHFEDYVLGKMLGQGAFAMVREAYHV